MFGTDLEEIIQELGPYLMERRLVIFFGAGVSVASGLPTGENLLKELGYGYSKSEMDLVRGDERFYRKLRELMLGKRPNDIHKQLALLRARYYITTNYDRLFESAMERLYNQDRSQSPFGRVVRTDDLSDVGQQSSTLIKLHGDIMDRGSIVAALSDYASHLQSPTVVDHFVAVTLATHPVLFVGYSISDINIVAQLRNREEWKSGVPPARFAIVLKKTEDERNKEADRMEGLGVAPILLPCVNESGFQESVEQLLGRLWEHVEDYGIFTQLLDTPKKRTLDTLWNRAAICYRDGDFQAAEKWMQQMEQGITDWRQHISLFGVYLYFSVKLHDKLEKWDDLLKIHKTRLDTHFKQVREVLPEKAWQTLLARYHAAIALPFYRIGALEDALSSINKAIEACPGNTADKEAQSLFADWHTIRAVILLSCWTRADQSQAEQNDCSASQALRRAREDLDLVKKLLEEVGGLGTGEETHYCGRFYGALAFLQMAEKDADGEEKRMGKASRTELTETARKAYDHPQRVPYGRLAGLYCAGFVHYWLARLDSADAEQQSSDLNESSRLLTQAAKAMTDGAEMAKVKVEFLQHRVEQCLNPGETHGRGSDDLLFQKGLSNLRSRSAKLAEAISSPPNGVDAWLRTPLN